MVSGSPVRSQTRDAVGSGEGTASGGMRGAEGTKAEWALGRMGHSMWWRAGFMDKNSGEE